MCIYNYLFVAGHVYMYVYVHVESIAGLDLCIPRHCVAMRHGLYGAGVRANWAESHMSESDPIAS